LQAEHVAVADHEVTDLRQHVASHDSRRLAGAMIVIGVARVAAFVGAAESAAGVPGARAAVSDREHRR
jgi:hypothetical protein